MRLFLRKSRVVCGRSVSTRSENAITIEWIFNITCIHNVLYEVVTWVAVLMLPWLREEFSKYELEHTISLQVAV